MLEGDLGDFSLPDILQLLAFTTKSGRLRMEAGGASGRVDLEAGRVRDASPDAVRLPLARRLLGTAVVDGDTVRELLKPASRLPTDLEFAAALAASGQVDADALAEQFREQVVDGVFDLLLWREGSFRFDTDVRLDVPPDAAVPAGWTVEGLLADAQQRLEEWPSIVERTGSGDATVSLARPADATTSVSPDGWALLALVDGRRTVADVVALSGRGEFRTRRLLTELFDAGVVALDAGGMAPVDLLVGAHEALAAIEAELVGVPEPAAVRPRRGIQSETAAPPEEEPEPWRATGPADEESEAAEAPGGEPVEEEREPEPAEAATDDEPAEEAPDAADDGADLPGEVTPLRTGGRRSDRLRTDPSVDAELIERLIDGVENL